MTVPVLAQTTIWKVDKVHASVKFEVEHLTIAIVAGQFIEFDGSMLSDKIDFTDAIINFTVQTKTIDTNVEMRDQDLRSSKFFDVEKYPEMRLRSTAIEKSSNGKYVLAGDLTIKDVTNPVKFDVTYRNTVTDPWGNTRTGFRATLMIDRFDYHISFNETFGSNTLIIAPVVKIIVDAELTKSK